MKKFKIKETCSCGAIFKVTGTHVFCLLRHEAFITAHEVCRKKACAEKSEREG